MRTGCPWQDIPVYFGFHNTIFKTFRRWSKHNKILNIFKNLIYEPDLEWVFIDVSSIAAQDVRAHQYCSGALGLEDQAISKSAGGNSTKIHSAFDSHGNPIEFIISDGTTYDVKVAPELVGLVDLSQTESLCADKGYDS